MREDLAVHGRKIVPETPNGAAGQPHNLQGGLQNADADVPGSTPDTAMVEIRLIAGTDPILARLGPAGFLRQSQMNVGEGDTVIVTGYWVAAGDGEVLVATQVAEQGKTVQLREGWGRPAW